MKPLLLRDSRFILEDEQGRADTFLRDHGMVCSDITTGADAWAVAHRTGLCKKVYDLDRKYVDAHIQTVLQIIFPNAKFSDRKRY